MKIYLFIWSTLPTGSQQEAIIKGGKNGNKNGENGVYSSLFRAKASGDTQKRGKPEMRSSCRKSCTRFALIGVGPARPRPCKCPPPQIPVSQSPF